MKSNTRTVRSMLIVAILVLSPLAEAKRFGEEGSHGVNRSSSNGDYNSEISKPTQLASLHSFGSSWIGITTGVTNSTLLGSMIGYSNEANASTTVASQPSQTENSSVVQNQVPLIENKKNLLWLLLIILVGIGYLIFRRFSAPKPPLTGSTSSQISSIPLSTSDIPPSTGNAPLSTSNVPSPTSDSLPSTSPVSTYNSNATSQPTPVNKSSSHHLKSSPDTDTHHIDFGSSPAPFTDNSLTLLDGTPFAMFLRQSLATFLHIQTTNKSTNLEELRHYFTPETFDTVQSDFKDNNYTIEFQQLDSKISNNIQKNGQYIVSVLYSGTVSENVNSAPTPFSETWYFAQAIGSPDQKWLVAGIQ